MNGLWKIPIPRNYVNTVPTAEQVPTCPPHFKIFSFDKKIWICKKCEVKFNDKQEKIDE